jgi:hypothetical protein
MLQANQPLATKNKGALQVYRLWCMPRDVDGSWGGCQLVAALCIYYLLAVQLALAPVPSTKKASPSPWVPLFAPVLRSTAKTRNTFFEPRRRCWRNGAQATAAAAAAGGGSGSGSRQQKQQFAVLMNRTPGNLITHNS